MFLFDQASGLSGVFNSANFILPLNDLGSGAVDLSLGRGTGAATFTRATSATTFDVTGTRITVGAGVARSYYDPVTHQYLGYLSEGAATNYFLNSGAPVTQTISLGTGTYTTWIEGAGSITTSAGTATATGYGVATSGTPNTITVTVAGTVVFTVAGTVTIAQVENTAFPTSYIATAGAAVTRNADMLTYSATSVSAIGSVYMELSLSTPALTSATTKFALNQGVGAFGLYESSSTMVGTLFGVANPLTAATSASAKVGARYATSNYAIAVNSTLTTSANATVPAAPSTIAIGSDGSTQQFYGNIKNVRFWQTTLTDSILQAITA